ncbi:MAG: hypothetical protein IT377_02475 [Polyangiaceae bacterium]|nr:hypothetical protein [Polyangiaceae bacterium]
MNRAWRVGCVGVLAAVIGCSSSGGGGSGSSGAASQKCDTLVDKLCEKLGPCQSLTQADCVSQVNQSFKQQFGATCSGADAVSATYDACLADLGPSYQCTMGTPDNCKGVILFQQ